MLLSSYFQLEKPYQKRKGWSHIRRCDNAHYCNLACVCHVLCLQNSAEHFVIYKPCKSLYNFHMSVMKSYSERKRQRKGEGGRKRNWVGWGRGRVMLLFQIVGFIWNLFLFFPHACVLSHVLHFVTPWNVACQPPLSVEISRQKY